MLTRQQFVESEGQDNICMANMRAIRSRAKASNITLAIPANTRCWSSAGLLLDQRLGWPNNKPAKPQLPM